MSNTQPPKPDTFANFLDLEDLESSEIPKRLEHLEACLANNIWINRRIIYLKELAKTGDLSTIPTRGGIKNSLSEGQMDAVVKLGIVKAWETGYITAVGLGKLAHSIPGLYALNDALLGAPSDQRAKCWGSIKDYPGEVLEIDLDKIRKCVAREQDEQ